MVDFTDKEETILRVAMDVFLEKGRHGAKMQEIADRAGINKAMLHYYFRSKENIYAQIFESVFLRMISNLFAAVDSSTDFKTHLRSLIGKLIDTMKTDVKIPLFVARELSEGGETVGKIVSKMVQDEKLNGPEYMVKTILKAKENGEIREIGDPRQFMITVIGACIYFFVAEPIFFAIFPKDENFDRDKFLEDRKEAVFNVLYNGIKP